MPEQLIRIPLGQIEPSKHNPRTIRENDPTVAELAESIRAHGLLQPVVCRDTSFDGPLGHSTRYELLAGRRRFEAHKLIEASDILAIVPELDDQAAIEVTVIENLQREDLSPMEEARGVRELAGAGRSYREIADRIGKSPAWCSRRAVLCDLIPEAVTAFEDPAGKLHETTIQHMELLARLPADVQARWLDDSKRDGWMWRPNNLREFKQRISAETRKLRGSAWPLDDATLYPEAGACESCPKRSSRQPELWDDDPDPARVEKNERCLDGACYLEKLKRHTQRKLDAAKTEHPNMIRVIGEIKCQASDAEYRLGSECEKTGALPHYHYKPSKQGAKGAVPALVVCGSGAGTIKWVIPERTPTNNRGRKVDADGTAKPLTLAEKRKQLECRRHAWVIGHVADALTQKTLNRDDIERPFQGEANMLRLVAFAATFGTQDCACYVSAAASTWKDFEKLSSDYAAAELKLWGRVADTLQERLKFYTPSACDTQYGEALRVAKLIGLPGEKVLLNLAAAAIPEPKSWAKEVAASRKAKAKKGAKKA